MAGLNKYVGWGLSTLALLFLNKGSGKKENTTYEAAGLSVAQTKLGTPVPVVMGRCLLKSPLISYYGDFQSRAYTETYAAHAKFNAWPLVFALIAAYISKPSTGNLVSSKVEYEDDNGEVTQKKTGDLQKTDVKDKETGPLINSLFMWLLNWLINGRNLKTTLQKGFKYYLGWQQILCWSHPSARLKRVYMNEHLVWEGDEAASHHADGSPFTIRIDDENLFGGVDERGGFSGELHVYFGGGNQRADAWMVRQMSAASVQEDLRGHAPAYRPYISVVVPTAYIGKASTIPALWFEVEIMPDALGFADLNGDVNPAEVFCELHTNRDWGLAESANLLDMESLKKVGRRLQEEKIGVSVPVMSKVTARSLIDDLLEHISGVRYIEPASGRMTYKLIRGDYDLKEVPLITTSNCKKISFTRQDWTNTISEVSATYTDRENLYETGSLSDTDAANIEMQNGTKTVKSCSLPYFTNAENALWAAKLELNQQGYPLAAVSLECNRQLAHVRIGDVVCLNFEPYGVKNMVLRVTDVDIGDFEDGTVRIEALEDVFSLAKTTYGFSGTTEWEKNPLYPTGVQNLGFLELPFELLQTKDTYVYAFACRPSSQTSKWTIWRKRPDEDFEKTNSMSKWTAAGRLIYDYSPYTDAEDLQGFQIIDLYGIGDLKDELSAGSTADITAARRGGKILMIGGELMAYANLSQLPNGNWRVSGILRGVYDTVPKAHGAGDEVFFLQSGHFANVTTGGPVCRAGHTATESYTVTTATVDKEEDFDLLKVKEITTRRRAERPCVQGKIRMFAHNAVSALYKDKVAGDLEITWQARNKMLALGCVSQDDEKDYWTGLAFSPPEGTEYITEVYVNEKCIRQEASTETYFSYTWAQRCLDDKNFTAQTMIRMYCRENQLESYEKQERVFEWTVPRLADIVRSEPLAVECMKNWDDGERVAIPAGALNDTVLYLAYEDMPIVLLGEPVQSIQTGALLNHDQSLYLPTGKALCFKSAEVYDLIDLAAGFTLWTKYTDHATEWIEKYVRWDGIKFVNVEVEMEDKVDERRGDN